MWSAARCATGCWACEVNDRDWVVVGATPEQMLQAGFRQVGADFPVFLHPQTNEEYALARTERKSAPGYRGFVVHADPSVTLEQDLSRRDLTINAMAMREDGTLVDPFGGAADLRRRCAAPRVARPSPRTRCASCASRASPRAYADFRVAAGDAGADAVDGRGRRRRMRWWPSACGRSWRAA